MTLPLTAPAATNPCQIHGYHQPAPVWTHRHHVIPKAWTDALGLPESRVVALCPHGHDVLHDALRKALKGEPYTAGASTRALVNEALEFAARYPEQHFRLVQLAP